MIRLPRFRWKDAPVKPDLRRLWREADEAAERLEAAIERNERVHLIDLPEYVDWKAKSAALREAAEQLLRERGLLPAFASVSEESLADARLRIEEGWPEVWRRDTSRPDPGSRPAPPPPPPAR